MDNDLRTPTTEDLLRVNLDSLRAGHRATIELIDNAPDPSEPRLAFTRGWLMGSLAKLDELYDMLSWEKK